MRNVSARIGAALALSLVLGAPGALGQTPPKKPAKGAAPTPAATPVADVAVTAPAPAVEVAVAPVATPVEATPPPTPVAAAPKSDDELDVTEKDAQKYYFIGLRYRGQLIPKAFIDIFVQGGESVYTNSIGLELDMRKDGFSLIPNITFTDYGTGNMLFLQQGKSGADVGNWSMVNSSLKVLYFGLTHDNVYNCASPTRKSLISHWTNLFQNDCAAGDGTTPLRGAGWRSRR